MKPFITWVGGKTQILDQVLDKFPSDIDTYHEIFVGGGSVLLEFLEKCKKKEIKCKKVIAYDINEVLINLYIHVQKRLPEFIANISNLTDRYNISGDKSEFYYNVRTKYNQITDKTSIEKTSTFLFLNKTCFRGLHREGPNGFNVSYGHKKNPAIFNIDHLTNVSNLIKDVRFEVMSFRESLDKTFKDTDYVYMDPPYVPENNKSFVGYTSIGFNDKCHIDLFNMCKKLNCNFLMSNSYTTIVTDTFSDYNIDIIDCKRIINPTTTQEVLVYN